MPLCHHQSDPATCPTCQARKTKEGKPLLLAIHDAVDQFSENHQALRGLMFNTLCVIIEMAVGPLVKAADDREITAQDRLFRVSEKLITADAEIEARKRGPTGYSIEDLRRSISRMLDGEKRVEQLNGIVGQLVDQRNALRELVCSDAVNLATMKIGKTKEEAVRLYGSDPSQALRCLNYWAHMSFMHEEQRDHWKTRAEAFLDFDRLKGVLHGEFKVEHYDGVHSMTGEPIEADTMIPWTTIKDILKAAALPRRAVALEPMATSPVPPLSEMTGADKALARGDEKEARRMERVVPVAENLTPHPPAHRHMANGLCACGANLCEACGLCPNNKPCECERPFAGSVL